MNWLEKVRYLKTKQKARDYDQERYFIDALYKENKWESGELEELIKAYSYVPKEYVEFIKEFDGSTISFATFYGSKKASKYTDLVEYVNEFKELLKDDYFPFAKDVDGSVFTFNRNEEVIWFAHEDFECLEPIKIADSFEEFVGEVLMGRRYHEFEKIENNTYYDLLKDLGWV